MKNKKILALSAIGAIAGIGLTSATNVSAFTDFFHYEDTIYEGENNMYYIDANKVNIECPSDNTEYKIDQNYDDSKPTWFRLDETCKNVTFDLNGKTVEKGAITIPGGVNLTMTDSVGGGMFKEGESGNGGVYLAMINSEGYGLEETSYIYFEGGTYEGRVVSNGRGLSTVVRGGTFQNSGWRVWRYSNINIEGGEFNDMSFTAPEYYGGRLTISNGTFNNTTFNAPGSNDNNDDGMIFIYDGVFNNNNYVFNADKPTITVYGGNYSSAPEGALVWSFTEVYKQNERYIIGQKFYIESHLPEEIVAGQTAEGTIFVAPTIVSDTIKITSSDDEKLDIICEDYLGTTSNKKCTLKAKKPGKVDIVYTSEYGHNGKFAVEIIEDETKSKDSEDKTEETQKQEEPEKKTKQSKKSSPNVPNTSGNDGTQSSTDNSGEQPTLIIAGASLMMLVAGVIAIIREKKNATTKV